jgi:glutathione synthase/RimK-type ligase-like ATP-grasp enzyme
MSLCIAIHPDEVVHKNGEVQSFSRRWSELAAREGVAVRAVDAFAPGIYRQLAGCDALMWRFGYDPTSLDAAKRVLTAAEHGMKLAVFPSWKTAWHFEDKVAQSYLLEAAGIPSPQTWVFWQREPALAFCHTARYPLVTKLSLGIQSNNVRLLRDADEAVHWVNRLFGPGLVSLQEPPPRVRAAARGQKQVLRTLLGRAAPPLPRGIQHGYFLAQEFLPGNEFDTRVTVIGDRAFGFRRFNRPGDFRASGSGRIDWDPAAIDEQTVRLAYRVARSLDTQCVAIDGLRRGEERVVGEISYTFASWAVRDCPGHWVLHGEPESGRLEWSQGQLRPEDAILIDFLRTLRAK